jgi:cob(I)alamin adenosyltransferase
MKVSRQGVIMVFTGKGKGKTTAAIGMGVRSVGHGRRVLMVQFMKGPGRLYGETEALKALPGFTVVQSGSDRFARKGHPDPEDTRKAQEGLDLAQEALTSGGCDLLILDEVNVAVDYGLVSEEDVLGLLDLKPPEADIILTGRGATEAIIHRADLVSEVQEVKHHYRAGVSAQAGIEF